MKRIEHCEEHCVERVEILNTANRLGRDGWSMVAVVPVPSNDPRLACFGSLLNGFDLYFKRECQAHMLQPADDRYVRLDVDPNNACVLH